jgi:F-box/leucine-rich repeat protein 7
MPEGRTVTDRGIAEVFAYTNLEVLFLVKSPECTDECIISVHHHELVLIGVNHTMQNLRRLDEHCHLLALCGYRDYWDLSVVFLSPGNGSNE